MYDSNVCCSRILLVVDRDCMDLSGEIQLFNDALRTFRETTPACDDRLCPSDEYGHVVMDDVFTIGLLFKYHI